MKSIIVGNEVSGNLIKECVERVDFLRLEGVYAEVSDALNKIREGEIDLVLLDADIPEINGFDFIKRFQDIPQVILITNKREYAIEAFEHNVTDFLLKPLHYPRFLAAVDKARRLHKCFEVSRNHASAPPLTDSDVFIKKDGKLIKIPAKEIIWIEALADYVNVYTTTARYIVLGTMKTIESKLPEREYARIHRSYIIRLDKIVSIDDSFAMIAGQSVPVSRTYRENLLKRLTIL